MTSFSIRVYQPTGTTSRVPVLVPTTLDVQPTTWSAVAKGGAWDAEIMLTGPLAELTGLTAWLGYQVEIVNERGTAVWWGDIRTVEIAANGLRRGISLDRMANRISLRYSQTQAGGGAAAVDTAWTSDTLSQATYGIWERRITPERELTTNEATALQATALTTLASPHYTLTMDSGQLSARLLCTGYWQRTMRLYHTELRGLVEHNPSGGTGYPLGLGVTSSGIAFSNRAKCVAQINGYFANFDSGYKVKVTGASTVGNNTTYTVTGADDRAAVVYSSTGVTFSPADDIQDSVGGLAFIQNDDLFQITGSAGNSGTQIMSKSGSVNVEVSGGYWGGTITSEAAGPTVNFYRGNQITVTPTPTNERASATITATVWGQKYYQTFTLSADAGTWTVDTVEIRLQRIGGPVDNVSVALYTDNAGAPNTLLDSATVAADDIPLEMDWVAFNFANTQALTYGTTYGLVVSRTGANDWDDYYMVDMDVASTYTGGSQKAYDGAAYQAINADLLFRVLGGVDTGTQVENILLAESWPSVLKTTSGVVSNQYRDGELKAYDELETLLDTGTSAGVRLCATVTRDRAAIIYAKPDKSTAKWMQAAANQLTDLFGQDAEPGYLPAGEWVKVGDASTLGPWAALSPIFVERAEYNANSGWSLEPENAADPFDTGTGQG